MHTEETEYAVSRVASEVVIGGMRIDVADRAATARLMLDAARAHPRGKRPLFFTSANGEVLARVHRDERIAALFAPADHTVADGQALVLASRLVCRQPLPERVATTDLFHDVARLAETEGQSFYFLGASEDEIARAVANVRRLYPRLRIAGACHGYLKGAELDAKLAEINALAPDILWLGLGVPREQHFVGRYGANLGKVGLIKTSGGLFNFLSGKNRRAPAWMQRVGLEWLWRAILEPRRLALRYLTTNPLALYLIATRSR